MREINREISQSDGKEFFGISFNSHLYTLFRQKNVSNMDSFLIFCFSVVLKKYRAWILIIICLSAVPNSADF
jgi:hypothetical protein